MIRLGVIFGGRSHEHEVSLMSAVSVIKAIDRAKFEIIPIIISKSGDWKRYTGAIEDIESGRWEDLAQPFHIGQLKETVEFVFPVLHGPYGEDGTIQGLFEMLDVPYAGCGVLGSALAMDKITAKEVMSAHGLPCCRYVPVFQEELQAEGETILSRIEEKLLSKYPVFVKPANMGSSVGIGKVHNRKELWEALLIAARYDRRLIVEEGICGREMETAVLGNHEPKAAAVGEIIPSSDFYDYHAKYFDGGQSKLCVPAQISQELTVEIQELAVRTFKALDGAGFARVDFFLENHTGKVFVNEVNTIPGFTKYSMFPLLWQQAGVTYSRLIERIVELGYERYHTKNYR